MYHYKFWDSGDIDSMEEAMKALNEGFLRTEAECIEKVWDYVSDRLVDVFTDEFYSYLSETVAGFDQAESAESEKEAVEGYLKTVSEDQYEKLIDWYFALAKDDWVCAGYSIEALVLPDQEMDLTLRDVMTDDPEDSQLLNVKVKGNQDGISIIAEGYSFARADLMDPPVAYVEVSEGRLRLLAYPDINNDDYTQIISLAGARNYLASEGD